MTTEDSAKKRTVKLVDLIMEHLPAEFEPSRNIIRQAILVDAFGNEFPELSATVTYYTGLAWGNWPWVSFKKERDPSRVSEHLAPKN